jgi:hypothetical protein
MRKQCFGPCEFSDTQRYVPPLIPQSWMICMRVLYATIHWVAIGVHLNDLDICTEFRKHLKPVAQAICEAVPIG